jgi:hypothetical protein
MAVGGVGDDCQGNARRDGVALEHGFPEETGVSGGHFVSTCRWTPEQQVVDADRAPICFNHRVTVPSVTVSPSWGMRTISTTALYGATASAADQPVVVRPSS